MRVSAAEVRCKKLCPDARLEKSTLLKDRKKPYLIITAPTGSTFSPEIRAYGATPRQAWANFEKDLKTERSHSNLKVFFDSMANSASISFVREDLVVISWSEKGRGFGEYSFKKDKEGKWSIDNECDNREEIKRVLGYLVDSLPLLDKV